MHLLALVLEQSFSLRFINTINKTVKLAKMYEIAQFLL